MVQKEIFNSAMKKLSRHFPMLNSQIETRFGAGLSCHFAVDKLHSVPQSLCQVFPQNH
jgi:hypothetical protein